jgi:hypothetical protein
MSTMYSPLNEDYMFQEMKNRTESLLRPVHREDVAARAGRRWWRRATHRAG